MPFVTLASYEFVVDHQHYDFVVVGAGGTGCRLASQLTEDPSVRVLLIEPKSRNAVAEDTAEFKTHIEPLMVDKTTRPNLTVLTGAKCTCVRVQTEFDTATGNQGVKNGANEVARGVDVVWATGDHSTSFFPQAVNATKDVILAVGSNTTQLLSSATKDKKTVPAVDDNNLKVSGIDNLRVANKNYAPAAGTLQKEYKLQTNPQALVDAVKKYEANKQKKQLLVTGGLIVLASAVIVGVSKSRGVRV